MFGGSSNSDKVNFLDEEREKLWERLIHLEGVIEELGKRTPEVEKEVKQSSKKASEYRNKARGTKEEIDQILASSRENSDEILKFKNEVEVILGEVSGFKKSVIEEHEEVTLVSEKVTTNSKNVEDKILKIEKILEEHPDLEEEIDVLEDLLLKSGEHSSKINTLHKNILARKSDIDELYYEIIGYDEENEETGEDVHVEGLKDQLETQYEELGSNIDSIKKLLTELDTNTKKNYEDLILEKEEQTKKVIDGWVSNYEALNKKIESLLPNALTAGLSSAYSQKKTNEIDTFNKLTNHFRWGILGLVLVSIIPFIVSVVFLVNGDSFDVIIERIPRLVIAILPLYLPVLWLAYSANKKINLSKRLIEEYTHKEVLSKTFEGLSTQIENLENDELSKELKVKLLFNFLQASSENPGKLITNYEKSDHPVMDVLEQSSKLESAVERLHKIPGMDKVAQLMGNKSKKILLDQEQRIVKGLGKVSEDTEHSEVDDKDEVIKT